MRAVAAAALLLFSAAGIADAGLQQCAAIKADAERLACYDALAGARASDSNAEFGLPERENQGKPDIVNARLSGPFDGWRPGQMFELDNGQVWRCVMTSGAYYPGVPDNPPVRLKRGFLGSYWLEIDGPKGLIKLKVQRAR